MRIVYPGEEVPGAYNNTGPVDCSWPPVYDENFNVIRPAIHTDGTECPTGECACPDMVDDTQSPMDISDECRDGITVTFGSDTDASQTILLDDCRDFFRD